MLRALDPDHHAERIRELMTRFRHQERWMTRALQDLQARLERHHREASYHRIGASPAADPLLHRCTELQAESDELATELVHVRMAIAGAGEELADLEGRAPLLGQRLGA